jgi:hypothetical protein
MDGTNLTYDTLTLGREGSTTNIGADMLVSGNVSMNNVSCTGLSVTGSVGIGNSQLQSNASSLTLYPFNLNTSVGGNLELNKNYGVYNVPYGQGTSNTDGGFTFLSTNADGTAGTNMLRLQNTPANTSRDLPGSYTGSNLASGFSLGYQSTNMYAITGGYRYITSPNVTVGKISTNTTVLSGQTYKCIFTVCAVSSATDTNVYIEDSQTVIFQLGLVGSVMKQFTFYFTAPNSLAIYIGVNGSASIQRTIDYQYFSLEPVYTTSSGNSMSFTRSVYIQGALGVGTSQPRAPLEVYSKGSNSFSIMSEGNLSVWAQLYANQGTLVSSDSRIKKNIKDIDDTTSLDILRNLNPKTYQYIDLSRTHETIYGFISQDIEKILPYAVSYIKQRIPNIYDFATVNQDILVFDNFNTNNLCYDASNNVYKDLYVINKQERMDIRIIEVINDNTIRINKDMSSSCYSPEELIELSHEYNVPFVNETNKIFVYGQEVTDFRALNKDAIWTVATAALQEVDRQLQAEKAKTALLETAISSMSSMMTSMLARLETLENKP